MKTPPTLEQIVQVMDELVADLGEDFANLTLDQLTTTVRAMLAGEARVPKVIGKVKGEAKRSRGRVSQNVRYQKKRTRSKLSKVG